MKAAKLGKHVALIEEKSLVGGNCTHLGTIPSKALRHSVQQISRFNTDPMFRELGEPRWVNFSSVLRRAERIIQQQVQMRTTFYARNRVRLYFGEAHFEPDNRIVVGTHEGSEILSYEHCVIATGSRPYRPEDVDFTHPRVHDSDTILTLSDSPRKIVIYGAGVIGCEYASIFVNLGVRVELINTRHRLLDFLDEEISNALSYHLRDQGVRIRSGEEIESLTPNRDGVVLNLQSGKQVKGEIFLWCNGRTGNTQRLNLDAVDLTANHRGQLEVNHQYRTANPAIWAAGDVIGWPALASAAYDQGRFAGASISGEESPLYVDEVPTGIYTLPEISSVGKTEQELTADKIPYEVGTAPFKTLARAQISGETVGMLKLLFHRETKAILGVHCFGYQASEIVHIGQAIMDQPGESNTIEYFIHTTFNYPTMAEAYRVAALNGLYRI